MKNVNEKQSVSILFQQKMQKNKDSAAGDAVDTWAPTRLWRHIARRRQRDACTAGFEIIMTFVQHVRWGEWARLL